jgi:hypothetical protein
MTRALVALLALGVLAGCGRYGPPRPPGPPDQVTFPRPYPAPDPVRPANAPPR